MERKTYPSNVTDGGVEKRSPTTIYGGKTAYFLWKYTPNMTFSTILTDDEWAFVASYLTLMTEEVSQRDHSLREVFNDLRWIVHASAQWRMIPNDLPLWSTLCQQTQRWIKAGVFEAMVHDLRSILRLAKGRKEQPRAVIFDSRTLQSTPESGGRAGYDGHKRKKGNNMHGAVDTLGHLPALYVTPANEQNRAQGEELARQMQDVTEQLIEVAFVDQGHTGNESAHAAQSQGMELLVIKLPEAEKGFALLPQRWVVKRSFGWMARFRRLTRDCERLPETLATSHYLAFTMLVLRNFVSLMAQSYKFITRSRE